MRKKQISNDRPIAIYDCAKKTLIGVFSTKALVAKYLFGKSGETERQRVYYYISNRAKSQNNVLGMAVALRYANEDQVGKLNGDTYFIVDGYVKPRSTLMKGFTDNKYTLHNEHCGKYRVYPKKRGPEYI